MNSRLSAMLEYTKTLTPPDQPDTYMFTCDELLKVGASKNWCKRLSDIRTRTGLAWDPLYIWPNAGFLGERMIQLDLEDKGLLVGSNCHHAPEVFYYNHQLLSDTLAFIGATVEPLGISVLKTSLSAQ